MIGYPRSSYLPRQCGHFEPIFDRFGPQTPELCHIYCTVRAGDEPVRHGAAMRYGPGWFRVVVGTCTGPGEPLGGPGYRLTACQLPHRPSNGGISELKKVPRRYILHRVRRQDSASDSSPCHHTATPFTRFRSFLRSPWRPPVAYGWI